MEGQPTSNHKKRKNQTSLTEPYSLCTNKLPKLFEPELREKDEDDVVNTPAPYDLESLANDQRQDLFRRQIASLLLFKIPSLRRTQNPLQHD